MADNNSFFVHTMRCDNCGGSDSDGCQTGGCAFISVFICNQAAAIAAGGMRVGNRITMPNGDIFHLSASGWGDTLTLAADV